MELLEISEPMILFSENSDRKAATDRSRWEHVDSPNSASEAECMGVMGGWSPASVPFLGRFSPAESSVFTWARKHVHQWVSTRTFSDCTAGDPHLLRPHGIVCLLLQRSLQVKVLGVVRRLGSRVANVALCVQALGDLHGVLGSHACQMEKYPFKNPHCTLDAVLTVAKGPTVADCPPDTNRRAQHSRNHSLWQCVRT